MSQSAADAGIAAEKARLRASMREKLASLPGRVRRENSARAVARLAALPEIVRTTNLVLHRPLSTEVDIDPYLTDAIAAGRRVFVPRVDGDRLALVRIVAETGWRRSTLGVLEPLSGGPLARELLEGGESVIVVPGLAFSPQGERLGRGGGHYDRLLAEIRAAGSVCAIGVAFDLQLVPAVASLEHDARVDRIVTETRVITPLRGSL